MKKSFFAIFLLLSFGSAAFAADCVSDSERIVAVHKNGDGSITEYHADGSQFTSFRDYDLAVAVMRQQSHAKRC